MFFILIQHDGDPGGSKMSDLIARLAAMGVDDAVVADGSDSATLVVDGVVESKPGGWKNNSIPCGPALRLHGVRTLPPSRLDLLPSSTDPHFATSLTLTDPKASLVLGKPGATLQITDLGIAAPGKWPNLLKDLGLTLPVKLTTPNAPLASGDPLILTGGPVTAQLTWNAGATGGLGGLLQVTTTRGTADFTVVWSVGDL